MQDSRHIELPSSCFKDNMWETLNVPTSGPSCDIKFRCRLYRRTASTNDPVSLSIRFCRPETTGNGWRNIDGDFDIRYQFPALYYQLGKI